MGDSTTVFIDSKEPLKSEVNTSTAIVESFFLISSTVFAKCSAPPSTKSSRFTQVNTIYFKPILKTVSAIFLGSSSSNHPFGFPVLTEQN